MFNFSQKFNSCFIFGMNGRGKNYYSEFFCGMNILYAHPDGRMIIECGG